MAKSLPTSSSQVYAVEVCQDPSCSCYGITMTRSDGISAHRTFTPEEIIAFAVDPASALLALQRQFSPVPPLQSSENRHSAQDGPRS